jgi:hypothetical protein
MSSDMPVHDIWVFSASLQFWLMIFKKVYGKCRVINICYCDITVTVNVPEGLPCMHALEINFRVLIEFGLTGNQARKMEIKHYKHTSPS